MTYGFKTERLVLKAVSFAINAHSGQVRKYTGEPYIVHPLAVADIVHSVPHNEYMIAAALLHDVVEDCGIEPAVIDREFGWEVGDLVDWLTDVSKPTDGNRAQRKAIDRAVLAEATAEAQTIKVADLIDNTRSIVKHDPKFAKVYLREKAALLDVMVRADPTLLAYARTQLEEHT